MTTTRDAIIDALISHSYTSYDYGYHCICGHTEANQEGMVGHIADKVLAGATLPAFVGFQIEWQVRDTKTGHIDDESVAFASREDAEQLIRDWAESDLELVCREVGTTDWHRPAKGAVA